MPKKCRCGSSEIIEIESKLVGFKAVCVDCGASEKSNVSMRVALMFLSMEKGEN